MRIRSTLLASSRKFPLLALLICARAFAATPTTAPTTLPAGLGVNIHFTSPQPNEMEQLAAAGFTFIRMDFSWVHTETKRGEYDFSAYETLLSALEPHGIRALFILDYANPLYDDNLAPHTDEGRKAFATWAAAGARHFKGRGILWEMWNEPNLGQFWKPKVNHDDYVMLALEVGKALREAAPEETYIGPACSGVDLPFLELCFKAGLLEYFSAVSVHPYRQQPPETVEDDYRKLRLMIAKYAPRGREKSIPIYSGEWGYSAAWSSFDEAKQGLMLPRQWLTNIANDVPVSIWYDWRDDGTDPKEFEHHFGTVTYDFKPKPAYVAAKKLTTELAGYRFNKRLWLKHDDDYVLLFTSGDDAKLAAWTTAAEPRDIDIPDVVTAKLTNEVQCLALKKSPALKALIGWARQPLQTVVRAPASSINLGAGAGVEQYVSLAQPLTRGQESLPIDVPSPDSEAIKQRTMVMVSNPLKLSLRRAEQQGLLVAVENPSGEPFVGTIRSMDNLNIQAPLRLAAGETQASVELPIAFQSPEPRAAIDLIDDSGKLVVRTPTYRFVAIPLLFNDYAIRAEGDKKVKSSQSVEEVAESPGMLQITYQFDAGWKYLCLHPTNHFAERIDGKPASLGMWIVGDGSGNVPRLRFVDSTGQTFQPDGPKLTWRDYRYLTFPLDGKKSAHWGGANDGVVHHPIRLETLLLIDSADKQKTSGTVKIESPTLIYDEAVR